MSPAAVAVAAENPVIDPAWYAREMATLATKLSVEFPSLPADIAKAQLQAYTEGPATK